MSLGLRPKNPQGLSDNTTNPYGIDCGNQFASQIGCMTRKPLKRLYPNFKFGFVLIRNYPTTPNLIRFKNPKIPK
mgnify:CR=1 FL=1